MLTMIFKILYLLGSVLVAILLLQEMIGEKEELLTRKSVLFIRLVLQDLMHMKILDVFVVLFLITSHLSRKRERQLSHRKVKKERKQKIKNVNCLLVRVVIELFLILLLLGGNIEVEILIVHYFIKSQRVN